MYYPFFLAYILTGLFIGGVVFVWALKSGQFSDQQRARFLAIDDVPPKAAHPRSKTEPKTGLELYIIFYIAIAAIAASFVLIGYALFFQ